MAIFYFSGGAQEKRVQKSRPVELGSFWRGESESRVPRQLPAESAAPSRFRLKEQKMRCSNPELRISTTQLLPSPPKSRPHNSIHPPNNDLTVGDWTTRTACPSQAELCSSTSKPPWSRSSSLRNNLFLVRVRGCWRSKGRQQRHRRSYDKARHCCQSWNEISTRAGSDSWSGAIRIQGRSHHHYQLLERHWLTTISH